MPTATASADLPAHSEHDPPTALLWAQKDVAMTLHIPQLIILALIIAGFGMSCAKHGQPKGGEHNAWIDLIASSATIALLWWGGFFS